MAPSDRARQTPASSATRERLLDAAMNLFAERGYAATTIGAIEKAAGLAPRSGALYQHFTGKDEILRSALERRMESLDELPSVLEMLPLGDLKAELRLIARWNLKSLAEREALTRFVLSDGAHVPQGLRRELYERLVARPYALAVAWVEQHIEQASAARVDVYALTVILVESMAAFTTLRTTFQQLPDGLDDDRFIEAWVDLAANAIQGAGRAAESAA